MIIKKYLAKTEKEAIEMAKSELGNHAIVMNIKKVRPKGLAKLFVRGKVEVTAALDETPVYDSSAKKEGKATLHSGPQKTVENPPVEEPKPEIPVVNHASEGSTLEDRLTKLQSLLEKQMSEKEEDRKKEEEKEKEKPQEQPKEATGAKEEKEQENERTKACKELIHQQLVQNEVDEEIAKSIMDEVNRSLTKNAPLDQILANVYQKIILMIGQPYLIDVNSEGKTKFIFFLGSTGVGKTTTIAKIASKLKLEKNANIALVTADTYRIAAVEQLKTYANILSVPLEVIYSPEELGDALEDLSQYDICLVDTAGRSHKNKEQIEDIRALIEQVPISERQVYLVLNAGTKYSDLKEIASVYSELSDFSIIFTKLDETTSAGAMLNMRVKTNCPLSYVTWGQNVPDDIGEIDAQKLAKQLLSRKSSN